MKGLVTIKSKIPVKQHSELENDSQRQSVLKHIKGQQGTQDNSFESS